MTTQFVPDYEQECEVCGNPPVVTVVEYGAVTTDTGLCGVCCWGEADMLYPEEWNR